MELKPLKDRRTFLWLKDLDLYFFYLFILALPFSKRLEFETPYTFGVSGGFLEYGTFFFYVFDFFLVTSFLLVFVKVLRHIFYFLSKKWCKNDTISTKIVVIVKSIRKNVSRETFLLILGFLFFDLWIFISSIYSSNKDLSFYVSARFLILTVLLIYFIYRITRLERVKNVLIFLFLGGVTQSLVVIFQYFRQKSVGLRFFGEVANLSPETLGIAKFVFENEVIVRGYGTFPHSNVLAGFLLLSIVASIILLFGIVSRETIWQIISKSEIKGFLKNSKGWLFSIILFVGLLLQILAVMFSYSRSAWVGLFIIFIFLLLGGFTSKMFHVKHFRYFLLLLAIFLMVIVGLNREKLKSRLEITENVSRETFWEDKSREIGIKTFSGVVSSNFYLGSGIGTFVLQIPKHTDNIDGFWNFQPVHNIYMLVFSELGIVGLIIFTTIIFLIIYLLVSKYVKLRKNVSRETFLIPNYRRFMLLMFLGLLLSYLFIGIFDHYFFTLDQGRFIFWLIIGFLGISLELSEFNKD